MPLPPAAERAFAHHRAIELHGYHRADDLWDIEAHLTDRRGMDTQMRVGRLLRAGELLHDISMRLTIDEDFLIHDVTAALDVSPFPVCPDAIPAISAIVGMRIGAGWLSEARKRLERTSNCTHLVELLGPLATTAFQTINPYKRARAGDAAPRVPRNPACYAHKVWRPDTP